MMTKKWTTNQIRQTWIDFWKQHDHYFLESASLIPKDDKSLLWINSGVATLKKYFSGQEKPPYPRLVNCQKSIRTNDITNVGLTSRHHTFFEMLGNFSIGNYFKKEAITWGYELLTKYFLLDKKRLYITVYKDDDDAYKTWVACGIDEKHIIRCDKDRNFWNVGQGPCGPCTEIYYDRGGKYDFKKQGEKLFFEDIENDRYVEIWNIVFSQYNNDGKNNYTELYQKNIDTGAGLERFACVLQDVPTNFDTDLFTPIIQQIQKLTTLKYEAANYFHKTKKQTETNYAFRIIADHLKTITFAISDGAIPSNKDRGYILRRLIRRAMVYAHKLQIDQSLESVVKTIITTMADFYPILVQKQEEILKHFLCEQEMFKSTLTVGYNLFEKYKKVGKVSGKEAFKLLETYGFPIELSQELANQLKIEIDLDEFHQCFQEHQKISKTNKSVAMQQQSADLLSFDQESTFLYKKHKLTSKIIVIFDENFHRLEEIDHPGKYWIAAEKTCLYATCGGQKADQGWLTIKKTTLDVVDVIKGPNLQHLHCVEIKQPISLHVGDKIKFKLNREQRAIIAAHHTSEHLLHKTLVELVDKNIKQEGASKNFEKLTFDFSYDKKLSDQQLFEIEWYINDLIDQNLRVKTKLLTLQEAKAEGAFAYFENVYQKIKTKLRVVSIGNFSKEICAGTHTRSTKNIEQFHILKLLSLGADKWRIEAFATDKLTQQYCQQCRNGILEKCQQIKNQMAGLQTNKEIAAQLEKINKESSLDWSVIQQQSKKFDQLQLQWTVWKKQIAKQNIVKTTQELFNKLEKNIEQQQVSQVIRLNDADHLVVNKLAEQFTRKYPNFVWFIFNTINKKTVMISSTSGEENLVDQQKKILNVIQELINVKIQVKTPWTQCCFAYDSDTFQKIIKAIKMK